MTDLLKQAREFFKKTFATPEYCPQIRGTWTDAQVVIFAEQHAEQVASQRVREEARIVTEVSDLNLFPQQYGDGTVLMGLPPNDIWQLGFAACWMAFKARLEDGKEQGE